MKAHAKINLLLSVGGLLPDGYHLVKTVTQPLTLHDNVTVEEVDQPGISIECNVEGVPTDSRNTAYKAADLVAQKGEKDLTKKGVKITIMKHIPLAGGLGGSAVDAAPVISLLNDLWKMNMSSEDMIEIGSQIGADVPQAIVSKTCYATGTGVEIQKVFSMPKAYVCVVVPKTYLENSADKTGRLYRMLDGVRRKELDEKPILSALNKQDWNYVAKWMHNDFEKVAFLEHPELKSIRDSLLANGAFASMLCGAGGSVFGLFNDAATAQKASEAVANMDNVRNTIVTMTKE